GNKLRIKESADLIQILLGYKDIETTYSNLKSNSHFKLRVTHHDTKISNVLFDNQDKGICVIDLDTVMPGYFISDVGDMMRTYLCPVDEDEQDYVKIVIRPEMYQAIVKGYYEEMKNELTPTEKEYFFYAGKFMIYMQALRFLTDYLMDDVYYPVKHPRHNFVRAGNQITLLQKLVAQQKELEEVLIS
ncbi:MAG: phosphotransferase, partial [Ferruginibacter sp.]